MVVMIVVEVRIWCLIAGLMFVSFYNNNINILIMTIIVIIVIIIIIIIIIL